MLNWKPTRKLQPIEYFIRTKKRKEKKMQRLNSISESKARGKNTELTVTRLYMYLKIVHDLPFKNRAPNRKKCHLMFPTYFYI